MFDRLITISIDVPNTIDPRKIQEAIAKRIIEYKDRRMDYEASILRTIYGYFEYGRLYTETSMQPLMVVTQTPETKP